jgi:hypothetical protein
LRTSGTDVSGAGEVGVPKVSNERQWRVFSVLYLLSLAVFAGWFVLLLIGLVEPHIMAFANKIALPTLLGSIICLELFRRLARRAEERGLAHAPKG